MKQLLTDIQTRLIAKVTALKYVDEDWGQLDFYSPNPPVKFPAAVIDCINATYTDEGKLVQLGRVQVRIRIADQKLSNTSGNAPSSQKSNAFAIYTTLASIHAALHGWSGNAAYSKLIRQSLKRETRSDGMRVHEIIYTTQLVDDGAMPVPDTKMNVIRVPKVAFV